MRAVSIRAPGKTTEPTKRAPMKNFLFSCLVTATLALPGNAIAQDDAELTVTISEWTVPYPDSRPLDPDGAPDGTIWLVGQKSHYVAHFDPDTGEFTKFDLSSEELAALFSQAQASGAKPGDFLVAAFFLFVRVGGDLLPIPPPR